MTESTSDRCALSVVVPAYNEEDRIAKMLGVYLPALEARFGSSFELIVVINGTTDDTEGVVRSFVPQFPQLKVLVGPAAIEKGGAVMWGFNEARGDLIGFADADGATPPEAFLALIEDVPEEGIVIASRWIAGADVKPKQPVSRRIASRIFNVAVNILFGMRVRDSQCGATLMSRETWGRIKDKMGLTQWAFDVDMLFQIKRQGMTIVEQPSVWHDVSGSKLDVPRASTQMAIAITRLRLVYSPFRFIVTLYDRFFGRYTASLTSEAGSRLLEDSLILMAASLFANVINFAHTFVMMAVLGKDGAYPTYAALLALIGIAGLPVAALMQMVAHRTALHVQESRPESVWPLARRVLRDVSFVAGGIFVLAFIFPDQIGGWIGVDDSLLVLLTVGLIGLSAAMPVVSGSVQGVQYFYWMSSAGIVWGATRLALGVVAVVAGFGVAGAITGQWIAVLGHIAICLVALRPFMKQAGPMADSGGQLYLYFAKSAVILGCFSGMFMLDSIVFNKFFDGGEREVYSRIGVLARSVVYLAIPVAWALFPKVVSRGGTNDSSARSLIIGLGLVAGISLSAVGACCLLAPWIARLLLHGDTPETVSNFRAFLLAVSPLALVYVIMSFEIAQERFRVMVPALLGLAVYAGGLWMWHESLTQVAAALGVAGGVTLAGCLAVLPWRGTENA